MEEYEQQNELISTKLKTQQSVRSREPLNNLC